MTTITTRAGKGTPLSWNEVDANFTNLNNDKAETTAVALKAPIDSPTFTGTPAAPTAAVSTNTTQVATTAFVNAEIANDAVAKSGDTMTGALKNTASQIGTSATATNNFSFEPTTAGAMKLARGNAGATTQDILTVSSGGVLGFVQSFSSAVSGGVSATSGSFGSASWSGTKTVIGNLQVITGTLTIDSVGTAAGEIIAIDANPTSSAGYGAGRSNITGYMLQVRGSGTSIRISTYDNTSPIAVGSLEFTCILGA